MIGILQRLRKKVMPDDFLGADDIPFSGKDNSSSLTDSPEKEKIDDQEKESLQAIDLYISYGKKDLAIDLLQEYIEKNPQDYVKRKLLISLLLEEGNYPSLFENLSWAKGVGILSDSEIFDYFEKAIQSGARGQEVFLFGRDIVDLLDEEIEEIITKFSKKVEEKHSTSIVATKEKIKLASLESENLSFFSGEVVNLESTNIISYWRWNDTPLIFSSEKIKDLNKIESDYLFFLVSPRFCVDLLLENSSYEAALEYCKKAIDFYKKEVYFPVFFLETSFSKNSKENYLSGIFYLRCCVETENQDIFKRISFYSRKFDLQKISEKVFALNDKRKIFELANSLQVELPQEYSQEEDFPLIIENREDSFSTQALSSSDDDEVLQELSSLMDYGQIDEAMDFLERKCSDEINEKYIHLLLDLYEKTDSLDRFSSFVDSVLSNKSLSQDITDRLFSIAGKFQQEIMIS